VTWRIKSRNSDKSVNEILADTPKQALDLLADQRGRNREAWIEDANGRPVDEATLKKAAG
jgi:hypothetical protein